MLLPACAPAPEPEPEAAPEPAFDRASEEAAIREVGVKFFAAANKHDAKAWLASATEDVETWTGNLKGKAAWEKYLTEERWERQKDIQYKLLDEIGIVFVTPDVAIYKYRDETTGAIDADGKAIPPYKRLYALVLVKKNGNWLWTTFFARRI
jgi:ketosteroid isomerase-like protein